MTGSTYKLQEFLENRRIKEEKKKQTAAYRERKRKDEFKKAYYENKLIFKNFATPLSFAMFCSKNNLEPIQTRKILKLRKERVNNGRRIS